MTDEQRAPGFPESCLRCEESRASTRVGDGVVVELFCMPALVREDLVLGEGNIPEGLHRPDWCPGRVITTVAELDDGKGEPDVELSTEDGLAMLWYLLFGPDADQPVDRGGYIRWTTGKALGIMRQIDERLVRIEKTLGLAELRFLIGDAEEGDADDETEK